MLLLHHLLLLSGVASGALFLIGDVVSGMRLHGDDGGNYSFISNTISELLIPTDPSRSIAVFCMVLSDLCGMAFGFGGIRHLPVQQHHIKSYRPDRRSTTAISGTLLGIAGTCNLFSAALFPQDERGGGKATLAGILHILLLLVTVLASLTAMLLMQGTFSRAFQIYTMASILGMCLGVVATPTFASRNMLGMAERFSAYSFCLWQAVTAVVMLKSRCKRGELR
jgi:hypothetical protein